MNRVLSNISVKMGLTLVLVIFSLLIIIIAFLGYRAGEEGSTSLQQFDLTGDRTLALSRSQRSIAYAQLFYVSSFEEAEKGNDRSAQEYLSQAQTAQQVAQDYFAEFQATSPESALAETVMANYESLVQQGLIPLEESLETDDEVEFNNARDVASDPGFIE
ncbi:Tar ligand binding domain-containing protein [Vreelandella arcis]|uniref:Tar ligand binding domain homologue n=1 Tax=Vreelandella arcis TaxID=416873 RepID=A0A1H0FTQ4_9GAMM|nr:Tar ligand binding domain-containing protein [Halomonas arcis]SDN98015.1 Tar ligand binding domain homologue [Halomonas arcis]